MQDSKICDTLVRYDLNLNLGCHIFYYLAPLSVLDPISLYLSFFFWSTSCIICPSINVFWLPFSYNTSCRHKCDTVMSLLTEIWISKQIKQDIMDMVILETVHHVQLLISCWSLVTSVRYFILGIARSHNARHRLFL